MSGYVGADAHRLSDLRLAVADATRDGGDRRRSIANLFTEAGEPDAVSPALAAMEAELSGAGCQIAAATETAAADAANGGQTGWRAALGRVDDVLLDVLWVNDLSRVFSGRDLNTGTDVSTRDRCLGHLPHPLHQARQGRPPRRPERHRPCGATRLAPDAAGRFGVQQSPRRRGIDEQPAGREPDRHPSLARRRREGPPGADGRWRGDDGPVSRSGEQRGCRRPRGSRRVAMTRFEQLRQLGAYLHQDWDVVYGGAWDAVRAFKRDASDHDLRAATAQAEELRAAGLDEEQLRRVVVDELGVEYWPPGDGLTFQAWLDELVRVLADSAG